MTTKSDRLLWRLGREQLCRCQHKWSEHIDQGNGYQICRACYLAPSTCTGWGNHPDDYAKI